VPTSSNFAPRGEIKNLSLGFTLSKVCSFLGCFAGGIYLALHYTLLQNGEAKLEDQALAILALFPIVSQQKIWTRKNAEMALIA
jgi:hypothetical protein